jgi:hypothetical protein
VPRFFHNSGQLSFRSIAGASFGWPFAAFEYSLWLHAADLNLLLVDVMFGGMVVFVVGRVSDRIASSRGDSLIVLSDPQRRWSRFHLSTAVLLALSVGVIGWVQTVPRLYMMEFDNTTNWACGWPMPILKWWTGPGGSARLSQTVFPPGVAVNVATAVLILATVARVLERRIQRVHLNS